MSAVIFWKDSTREELRRQLPEAVVVLPIGATEQHGPHLPVRTDLLIAEQVAAVAAETALTRGSAPVIVAPGLPFGASAHHLAYGGTLSLGSRTLLAVLEDLIDSIEQQGGRRLLILNGHGGNRGAARAAASAADARSSITVAAVDYWDVVDGFSPGHAGSAETSLVLAIAPELVEQPLPARAEPPVLPSIGAASFHGSWVWKSIDGFTDDPATASAADGARYLNEVTSGIADMIVALGKLPA